MMCGTELNSFPLYSQEDSVLAEQAGSRLQLSPGFLPWALPAWEPQTNEQRRTGPCRAPAASHIVFLPGRGNVLETPQLHKPRPPVFVPHSVHTACTGVSEETSRLPAP